MDELSIVGISGSLRRRSYNTALLHIAGASMPEGMQLSVAEIGDLPLYNHDVEVQGFPDPVARLRRQVGAADGLLIASPEYNYSVTAPLKNALDWLSRPPSPLDAKPAAILGAGGRLGTARAQRHLRDIALHNDLRIVQKPEVLITEPWKKFDDALNLTDGRSKDQIVRLMAAFHDHVVTQRGPRMRVLVVGRHPVLMEQALSSLRQRSLDAFGVFDVASARQLIEPGRFAVVAAGGGITQGDRESLAEHVSRYAPGTLFVEVSGQASLLAALEQPRTTPPPQG